MSQNLKTILVCLSLATLGITCGQCGEQTADRYLLIPTESDGVNGFSGKSIDEAFCAIDVEDTTAYGDINKRVEELKQTATAEVHLEVYKVLGELVSQTGCPSGRDFARNWARIYVTLENAAEYQCIEKFSAYVRHLSDHKLAGCASKAEEDFVELDKKGIPLETDFNQFLISLSKLKPEASEWDLKEAGEKFELIKVVASWRKRRALLKYAQARSSEDNGVVAAYLRDQCEQLREKVTNQFDILNWAEKLGAHKMTNSKLMRFNEFNRIFCIDPQKPELKGKIVGINSKRRSLVGL